MRKLVLMAGGWRAALDKVLPQWFSTDLPTRISVTVMSGRAVTLYLNAPVSQPLDETLARLCVAAGLSAVPHSAHIKKQLSRTPVPLSQDRVGLEPLEVFVPLNLAVRLQAVEAAAVVASAARVKADNAVAAVQAALQLTSDAYLGDVLQLVASNIVQLPLGLGAGMRIPDSRAAQAPVGHPDLEKLATLLGAAWSVDLVELSITRNNVVAHTKTVALLDDKVALLLAAASPAVRQKFPFEWHIIESYDGVNVAFPATFLLASADKR